MRKYIFTERERKILHRFVEKNEKLDGFAVLFYHLRRCNRNLCQDFKLVETVMKKKNDHDADDLADRTLKEAKVKEKARLRTRGPYRKSHL